MGYIKCQRYSYSYIFCYWSTLYRNATKLHNELLLHVLYTLLQKRLSTFLLFSNLLISNDNTQITHFRNISVYQLPRDRPQAWRSSVGSEDVAIVASENPTTTIVDSRSLYPEVAVSVSYFTFHLSLFQSFGQFTAIIDYSGPYPPGGGGGGRFSYPLRISFLKTILC